MCLCVCVYIQVNDEPQKSDGEGSELSSQVEQLFRSDIALTDRVILHRVITLGKFI